MRKKTKESMTHIQNNLNYKKTEGKNMKNKKMKKKKKKKKKKKSDKQ